MKRTAIAAFFDFDLTLLEVESGHMGIRMLRERRMLPLGYFLKVGIANLFYRRQWLSEAVRPFTLQRLSLENIPAHDRRLFSPWQSPDAISQGHVDAFIARSLFTHSSKEAP